MSERIPPSKENQKEEPNKVEVYTYKLFGLAIVILLLFTLYYFRFEGTSI